MRRPRGLSLRTKWSLALLGTALVPLLGLGPLALRLQRSGLIASETALQAAVASQTTKSVTFAVTSASDAAHRIGLLLTSASSASERDPEAGANLIALAKAEVESAETLSSLVVYDADGAYIDAITRTTKGGQAPAVGKEPLPAALRASAERDGSAWARAEAPSDPSLDALTYVEPLKAGGKTTGFVRAYLEPGALSRLVGSVASDRFGDKSRDAILLADDQLRVVAIAPGASLKVGDSLRGKYMFSAMDPGTIHWDVSFQGATGTYAGPDGEPSRAAFSTLARHKWLAVVQRPERESLAALRDTQRAFVLALFGAALFAVVLGGLLAARSTRPIESLVGLARRLGRREFEARAEVRTGDELEELGDALGEMASSIQAGEAEIAKKTLVEAQLSRYLPGALARSIADGTRAIALGGERRPVSVVFADIASFTSFAERSSPEAVVAFLNEVFSILSEVVFRHGGMVDKFMGDCIMAVFGATEDQPDHAERALAAAEDMHRFVETQAPDWKAKYGFDVRLGIGVTSGEALVGNLGSETRMEFTAIGDTVNTAARLENLAQAGQTLVSSETALAVGDAYELRPLGPHALRGKREPVELFELVV
ncbi:MAG TPA: adenylate/guanylate cyclase domain-containing protein [Polyangiaceae bacterium]|nr:adenylate/guanylate cyclase domain-containing protein [Polyangiaceae bacterium]